MSRSLNGSSEKLTYLSTTVSNMPLTIGGWVNPSSTSGSVIAMLSDWFNSGALWFGHYFGVTTGPKFYAATAYNNTFSTASIAASNHSTATWYHILGTWVSTTSRTLYVDGVAATTDTSSITDPAANINGFTIGASYHQQTIGDYFAGSLAEWGIWNVALTAAEISSLAKGFSPTLVRPASLFSYWPIIGRTSPEIEIKGGRVLTLTGTCAADAHPRIIYPGRSNRGRQWESAAAGGLSIPVAAHSYRQRRIMV